MNYLQNTIRYPYFNMALDEYCLMNMDNEEPFFYLWQNDPTVVIGAHQNVYKEIDLKYLEDNAIYLVRRMSGGGAVFHDKGNVNFTFIGKICEGENEFHKYVSYVVEALKKIGLQNVELSGRNDIYMNGAKISGCAKRVYQDRCMVHGTLLYDVNTEVLKDVLNGPQSKTKLRGTNSVRKDVANIAPQLSDIENVNMFISKLQELLINNHGEEIVLTNAQNEEVKSISSEKYENSDWIYGKNIKSNISYSKKFNCGTVDVDMLIVDNRISDIHFSGDFIGREKIIGLELKFKTCIYQQESVSRVLENVNVSDYFDSMNHAELLDFIFGNI